MKSELLALPSSTFQDTSTECAICLASLGEGETIKLTCGHRWHLSCVREQLERAQPNRARRLLFSGCRCAKCGAYCDHPALQHLTRRTDALRERVDALVEEQARIDAPQAWRDADGPVARRRLVDEGRRSYAFYLCGLCDDPYFGGTVACADGEEGELPSGDRLCPTCSPKSQAVCRRSFEHQGFHVWKCRYCCEPSSFVCYGTVHFCASCHDRNTERARVESRRRGVGGGAGPPPALEAVPCRGESCPHPKPEGRDTHSNGPSSDCEQVYSCALCCGIVEEEERHGSRNFVVNPSGERGLVGWRATNFPRWRVEPTEVPMNEGAQFNFVSSFQWCVMVQTVPLHRYVRHPGSMRLEVSAKFMGRTDCPSVFRMEAILTNDQGRSLHRVGTGQLAAPVGYWERTSLIINPINGAHEITMVVWGKDRPCWTGNYGSKVCQCSVRVLCSESELQNVLRVGQNNQQAENTHGGPNYAWLREHAYELLLPILLIAFVWMISD